MKAAPSFRAWFWTVDDGDVGVCFWASVPLGAFGFFIIQTVAAYRPIRFNPVFLISVPVSGIDWPTFLGCVNWTDVCDEMILYDSALDFAERKNVKPPFMILSFGQSMKGRPAVLLSTLFQEHSHFGPVPAERGGVPPGKFNWTKGVRALAIFFLIASVKGITTDRKRFKQPSAGPENVGSSRRPSWVSTVADLVETIRREDQPEINPWWMAMFQRNLGSPPVLGELLGKSESTQSFISVSLNTTRLPFNSIHVLCEQKVEEGDPKSIPPVMKRFAEVTDPGHLESIANQISARTRWGRSKVGTPQSFSASRAATHLPVLAVFPFRAGQPNVDGFTVAGFYEDTVSRMSKIVGIRMISPETIKLYPNAASDVVGIGRTLKADAVLTGRIRRWPSGLHVNLHLTDPKTGFTMWSDVLKCLDEDFPEAVGKFAPEIAERLGVRMSESARIQMRVAPTEVSEAYEAFLRGAGLIATNKESDLNAALRMLNQAVEDDPKFADAHAYRAYALWRKYFSGWRADASYLKEAEESASRALSLDRDSAIASLARIRIFWDNGKLQDGLAEGVRAFEINPDSVDAILALARACNNAGMAEHAIPLVLRVLRREPSNPSAKKLWIWNLLMVGNYHKAREIGGEYLHTNPQDSNTSWAVAMANVSCSDFSTAIKYARKGLAVDKSNFTLWLLLGHAHRLDKDPRRARDAWGQGIQETQARLEGFETNWRVRSWLCALRAAAGSAKEALKEAMLVEQNCPTNAYLLYRLAHAYAALGIEEEAVRLLNKAVSYGWTSVQLMNCEEMLDLAQIASSPDYQRLVKIVKEKVKRLARQYRIESRAKELRD